MSVQLDEIVVLAPLPIIAIVFSRSFRVLAPVGVHLALDPDIVTRGEGPGTFGQNFAPDPAHDGAGLVAKHQGEVGFTGFVGAGLHLAQEKELLHQGAFLQLVDELMGHGRPL